MCHKACLCWLLSWIGQHKGTNQLRSARFAGEEGELVWAEGRQQGRGSWLREDGKVAFVGGVGESREGWRVAGPDLGRGVRRATTT